MPSLLAAVPADVGPFHPLNWIAGWWLILAGFMVGAGLGLFFHRDDFWGGYDSFRRRIVRLGHIALEALGLLNLLFALSPWPRPETWWAAVASPCFVAGGVAMPCVCFLTAWKKPFRHLFILPVLALVLGVAFTLAGGGR
jgi:hypothetical protein